MRLLFVQPYGIAGAGGGAQIMRSLVTSPGIEARSICTSPQRPPPTDLVYERHVAARRTFGRLEHTRLGPRLGALEPLSEGRIRRAVRDEAERWRPEGIHVLAHSMDFWPGMQAARDSGIPVLLTVHDDLRYALRDNPARRLGLRRLKQAWRSASARFVITRQLGREYNRRYGQRDFVVVTDGLESLRPLRAGPKTGVRAYFMGAYHVSYRSNFEALLDALTRLESRLPAGSVSLTLRGGGIPFEHRTGIDMRVLGFGSQEEIEAETASASFLYLPLPFGRVHRDFVRWSLSTKLVTYLGAGRPILYHGPRDSAAADLLTTHRAAVTVHTQEPDDVAAGIEAVISQDEVLVGNAIELARERFMLEETRRAFLSGAESAVAAAKSAHLVSYP